MVIESINAKWLALTTEAALEPELPICDPHHHLWPEATVHFARIAPRYLLDEILADVCSGHNIVSTVFVECGVMYKQDAQAALQPVGETQFANEIAEMSASGTYGSVRIAAGIVGAMDLRVDCVDSVLDAHIAAGGGRFRGIRQRASWDPHPDVPNSSNDPPPRLFLDDDFRSGFAHLARHQLTFDAWCYHHQLPELADLARRFPETTIILNHLGGPVGIGPYAAQRDEVFGTWRSHIKALRVCPNLVLKLGGLNMEVNGFGWHKKLRPPSSEEVLHATRHYYEFALEQFGVDRCMFESNYPVDKLSCSYNVVWNVFKRLTAGYTADEKAKLFHDNAARIYRLGNLGKE